jgi:hypothetical protein
MPALLTKNLLREIPFSLMTFLIIMFIALIGSFHRLLSVVNTMREFKRNKSPAIEDFYRAVFGLLQIDHEYESAFVKAALHFGNHASTLGEDMRL